MPWTAEQARAASRKGWEASRAIRAMKGTEVNGSEPAHAERYALRQLLRTRKQIDLLNDILEDRATEMKDRKAAAEAKARLYEIEAALANRPKPGQRRPGRERERPMQPTRAPTPIVPKPQSAGPAPQAPSAVVDTTSFDCGL